MSAFHALREPTVLAASPSVFSPTSLSAIDKCPRQWLWLHSEWGHHRRYPRRLHLRALEGIIVHGAIERLLRAVGQVGNPAIGSPAFQKALAAIDFWGWIEQEVERWQANQDTAPGFGASVRIGASPAALANQAVRLFREQYRPETRGPVRPSPIEGQQEDRDLMAQVRARGALPEVGVEHPSLPFRGVLDLVTWQDDQIAVVDFKTGSRDVGHEWQVRWYGLLWWRATGVVPGRLVLQYLDGQVELPLDETGLQEIEAELAARIEAAGASLSVRPPLARTGAACATCTLRARCDEGWRFLQAGGGRRGGEVDVDVEVRLIGDLGRHGFTGETAEGEVAVVWDAGIGQDLLLRQSEVPGRVFRLTDARALDGGKTIQVRGWTEVVILEG